MLFVKFDEVREVLVREGWVALAVGEPIDHLTADARVEVQLALPRLGELLQGVDVLRLELCVRLQQLCVRLQQLGVVAAQSLELRRLRSGGAASHTCLLLDVQDLFSLGRDQRLEPRQFLRLRVEGGEGGVGGLGVGGHLGVGWLGAGDESCSHLLHVHVHYSCMYSCSHQVQLYSCTDGVQLYR
jgi:hypothetical protein